MPAAVKDSPNKIFVSNMPKSWSDSKFQATFEVFGKIAEVNLMKNRESGQSRGFGFITFESEDDAGDAIQGMNGKEIEGNTLKVDTALKSLHASGGGDRGRGRGGMMRGGRGGPPRGRGGPLLRGGPRGGFSPRGGLPSRGGMPSRGGPMMRGRGGPPRGMGKEGESSFRGRGGMGRGMGRGMEGPSRGAPRGAPRGGLRGAPRGSPRGAPRGAPRGGLGGPMGRGRGAGRPPMDDFEQDTGYGAPRGRSLLGKEPLLQNPGAPDYASPREPRSLAEREPDSYRGPGYSQGGSFPAHQSQFEGLPSRRNAAEPLLREREPLAPRPSERFPERSRAGFPAEREPAYGSRSGASQYQEESYGSARGAREDYAAPTGGRAASSYDYADTRPSRSDYATESFRRDPYASATSDVSAARPTRDSFGERDYAPSSRSMDAYSAASASSAAPRGYGAREQQALAREPAMSRETPRGRESLLAPRDYAPPRTSARDYAEPRREEPVRDYARSSRPAYPEERASASYGSRSFDEYEKAASRGYGGGADAYGSARDPAGSAPSSRAAYSSRDPYSSGRGDRAEKPSYGDPYRSGPSYGARSAPSDRNGGGASSRPFSRY